MRQLPHLSILLLLFMFCPTSTHGQEESGIRLRIEDRNGRSIPPSETRISVRGMTLSCADDAGLIKCDGAFKESDVLSIDSDGKETVSITIAELKSKEWVLVMNLVEGIFEVEVFSEGERSRLSPLGMSQVSLRASELNETAAPVIDDALRQVAGFSTFRRTSGRQANPTTQGVSLRGVGSSGASRTAVIEDGVSINDPFGGWVQWNRVVQPLISEVEVLRGGASGFFGNSAVSGAIRIRPLNRRNGRFSGELFGGTHQTLGANGRVAETLGRWLLLGGFSSLRTRGYVPVEPATRGLVDAPAGVRYDSLQTRISGNIGDELEIVVRPGIFGEVRTNGTGIQTNRTHSRSIIARVSYSVNRFQLSGRINGLNQVYDQMFSTVAGSRNSETLNRVQRVPSRSLGYSIDSIYTTTGSFLNSLNIGLESRDVRGASDEISFSNNLPITRTGVGGGQRFNSFFANNRFVRSRLVLNVSARADLWRNRNGLSVTTPVATGLSTPSVFADRSYSRISGRAGISVQVSSRINLFTSFSTSFRAPTLNELYRGFRVGNILTQPNDGLRPEKGWETDSGIVYSTTRFRVRGSFFSNNLSDTVSNITVASTPSLITRQRRNVGRTLSRGIEFETEGRLNDSIVVSAGYLLADSTVREFDANPALIGLKIPQVATHQGTFQARWNRGDFLLTKQMRISGPQYDDDLNLFRLEGYMQLDLYLSYSIKEGVKVFGAVENLFNTRYSTAKTPIRSIAPPLGARFGIRWN